MMRCGIVKSLVAASLCMFAGGWSQRGSDYIPPDPKAKSIVVLGGSDIGYMFINVLKQALGPNLHGGSPHQLDVNGLPVDGAAPTSNIIFQIALNDFANYVWELKWSGTTVVWLQNRAITTISDPRACYNAKTGMIYGANCDLQFTFNVRANKNVFFTFPSSKVRGYPAGVVTSRLSHISMIRIHNNITGKNLPDKALYESGQIFTPEFLNVAKKLRVRAWRMLGLTFSDQQNENQSQWRYRKPVTAFSYATYYQYPPTIWAANSTNIGNAFSVGAYQDMPSAWTDREEFQANITSAGVPPLPVLAMTAAANGPYAGSVECMVRSTVGLTEGQKVLGYWLNSYVAPTIYSVHIVDGRTIDLIGTRYDSHWAVNRSSILSTATINVGGRGPKFLVRNAYAYTPTVPLPKGVSTFVYDKLNDVVYWKPNGIAELFPPEIEVAIANATRRPMWWCIPPYFDDASVIEAVAYFNANLRSDLILELDNETWNNRFMWSWYFASGLQIGIRPGGNVPAQSFTGLRSRQMMDAIATSKVWTRPHSQLHWVLAAGATSPGSGVVNGGFDLFDFQGHLLCGKSCGNAAYEAKIGVDYNVSPRRPIDGADAISYQDYFQGAQVRSRNVGKRLAELMGSCDGTRCTGIISAGRCYAAPADSTCGPGGTAQEAINFMDTDTHTGVLIGGNKCPKPPGQGCNTISGWKLINAGWNKVAISENKPIWMYEGAYSGIAPSVAHLKALGEDAAAALSDHAAIEALILAYRSSPLMYLAVQDWIDGALSIPNSRIQYNSWLTVTATRNGIWNLINGDYVSGTPYKTYSALVHANGGPAGP